MSADSDEAVAERIEEGAGVTFAYRLDPVDHTPLSTLKEDEVAAVAEWARKEALREAADTFDARLADGTGNGRAYNSYTVARMLRALADGDAS